MLKKIILLIAITSGAFARSEKKHIIIKRTDEKDVITSKNFLRALLPPLVGIGFLDYAITARQTLGSPVFLLRGANACILGALHAKNCTTYYDNEKLLRLESAIIGGLLLATSTVKILDSVNNAVVQPVVESTKKAYNFVKNHALLCGLVISSGLGLYYYLE